MNAKQIGDELAKNLSAFVFGIMNKKLNKQQQAVMSDLIVAELKNYRPSFIVDRCRVLNAFGKEVYVAPTCKQAQEIVDSLNTYVG